MTRITTLVVFSLVSVCTAVAGHAQEDSSLGYYGIASPPSFYHHASTFAEGVQRGRADLVRAAGEYNYNTAIGLIRLEQARRLAMENNKRAAEIYFEKRDLNKQQRADKLKPVSQEKIIEMAREKLPDRLTPQQFRPTEGEITWPGLLQEPKYAEERTRIEALVREMAFDGKLDSKGRAAARQWTQTIVDKLRADVHFVTPMDYVEARKFLISLDYEFLSPAPAKVLTPS